MNATGIRTVSLAVVCPSLVFLTKDDVSAMDVSGANFPGLKAHLDHAIEWRMRSARLSFTSVRSTDGFSVAGIIAPTGASWKPATWVAIETSGGSIKPVKNSGWSSNSLGAQEQWTNHANTAAMAYWAGIGNPDLKTSIGVMTLHATVQLRGNR